MSASAIGIGVVGYGYWGPNMVRNIVESQHFDLCGLCERDEQRIDEFQARYPDVRVERVFEAVLRDPSVDAVAIATPPHTHFELVSRALEAGKHVLVEKPLAPTSEEATQLAKLAAAEGLVLLPGHTFVYSPSVDKVRELIVEGEAGEIFFITSSRMNLGRYQKDGVVLDLAPHDLSILFCWLGQPLREVSASGHCIFRDGVHETAFLTLSFEGNTKANIQLSWLAPRKMREMVVVGSRRMIQYLDTAPDESVRIYDRGLDFSHQPANFGEYKLTYRAGDMVAPRIEPREPLALELDDFAEAIRNGTSPRSDAEFGLQIVLALEALEESLRRGGAPVAVKPVEQCLETSSSFVTTHYFE
ncbi:MAG TPA: Gfo/Idh/MocA family oxidoreductase [Solirubrobacterales bacterium]|jgi:predicted dehydrogenase